MCKIGMLIKFQGQRSKRILLFCFLIPVICFAQKPQLDITHLVANYNGSGRSSKIEYRYDCPIQLYIDSANNKDIAAIGFKVIVDPINEKVGRKRSKLLISFIDEKERILVQYKLEIKINSRKKAIIKKSVAQIPID